MRRSLGTAVFSGMLGVTLFGIFLTPVFFYVIQGLGETRFFAGRCASRRIVSLLWSAGLAAAWLTRLLAGANRRRLSAAVGCSPRRAAAVVARR